MPKDSQIDPKMVREKKANGPTLAQSETDSGNNNTKKQSGNRHQSGDDKKKS